MSSVESRKEPLGLLSRTVGPLSPLEVPPSEVAPLAAARRDDVPGAHTPDDAQLRDTQLHDTRPHETVARAHAPPHAASSNTARRDSAPRGKGAGGEGNSDAGPPAEDGPTGGDSTGGDGPSRWRRLPIFPLPQVQLFPHALLPLHVFEPRYRAMVKDALAGTRLIAIAALEPGFETDYHGRPNVRTIIGIGEVVGHEPLGDGRANILLRGVARAVIDHELPPNESYRLVDASELSDAYPPTFDREGARDTLLLLSEQLARQLPSGGETLRDLAQAQPDASALVDVLASALVTDPDDRQALLETADVAARVDRVGTEIAAILSRLTPHEGPVN
jgi:Lon protease-like protein